EARRLSGARRRDGRAFIATARSGDDRALRRSSRHRPRRLSMNRDAARAIEWDCAQLLIRFFNEFDAWRYREMVKLFAPEGVGHREGGAVGGPVAILAALEQRSTTQTVRHVVTNVEVTALDEDPAKSLLSARPYQHDAGGGATAPPV